MKRIIAKTLIIGVLMAGVGLSVYAACNRKALLGEVSPIAWGEDCTSSPCDYHYLEGSCERCSGEDEELPWSHCEVTTTILTPLIWMVNGTCIGGSCSGGNPLGDPLPVPWCAGSVNEDCPPDA
jgi:hypothetical protein